MSQLNQNVVPPILRLPLELLQTIVTEVVGHAVYGFRSCDAELWLPEPLTFDASSPIWMLSHVCSVWRAAIQSLPALWSNLGLKILKNSLPRNASSILEQILLWSSGYPLTIRLIIDDICWDERAQAIVVQLIGASARWQSITMKVPGEAMECFSGLTSLEQLVDLDIDLGIELVQEDWGLDSNSGFRAALCKATRLRGLKLGRGTGSIIQWPLPWRQLKSITLPKSASRQAIRQRLIQLRELEFLELDYCNDDDRSPPEPRILMPHLTHLWCSRQQILIDMSLPALEHVSIIASDALVKGLIDCVDRSSPSPRQLELTLLPFHLSQPPLTTCLRAMATLTTLHTYERLFGEQTSDLLRALIYNPNDPQNVLLPQLEELRVTNTSMNRRVIPTAKICVTSRWCLPDDVPVQRLRIFRLVVERGTGRAPLIRPGILQQYYQEGLDVTLEMGNGVSEEESWFLNMVFGGSNSDMDMEQNGIRVM